MIDWEKLLRKARIALGDAADAVTESRFEKLIKYIKFRIDRNIYQRKETVVLWNESGREKETKVSTIIRKAESFADYCRPENKSTVYEYKYIFEK